MASEPAAKRLQAMLAAMHPDHARYIQSVRLEARYRSLIDPKYASFSITDIAVYWGFYDLPHMTRCFRKAYGATPSGVRSRILEH